MYTARTALERTRKALRGRAVILVYHRVAETALDAHRLGVDPESFAEQLGQIARHYQPISLKQLLDGLREGRLPGRAVAVTLDDGYADNLLVAKPLLERYSIPATVFVTSSYLDGQREFWWDELSRLMFECPGLSRGSLQVGGQTYAWSETASRESAYEAIHRALRYEGPASREDTLAQLRDQAGEERRVRSSCRPLTGRECQELERGGLVTVGAHTENHLWMTRHALTTQRIELEAGRRVLEEVLGHGVEMLAYPYGKREAVSRETVELARELGFGVGCSHVRGQVFVGSDPLWLARCSPGKEAGKPFAERLRARFQDFTIRGWPGDVDRAQ